MAPSTGAARRVCYDTTAIDISSIPLSVKNYGIVKTQIHLADEDAMTGSRSHKEERVRDAGYRVSGPIELAVSRVALDNLLPNILGTAENINVFALAETLIPFFMMADLGGDAKTHSNLYVNSAVFRGAQLQQLLLTLNCEGKTETSGGTYPVLTTAIPTDKPYVFSDCVLTLGGTAYSVFDFEITIDNVLDTERFLNSLTRGDITPTDRIVKLKCTVPYTSTEEAALYNIATAGLGSTNTLVCTNAEEASSVLTFTFGELQAPTTGISPINRGGEVVLPLEFTARMSGSTDEISITNAHA